MTEIGKIEQTIFFFHRQGRWIIELKIRSIRLLLLLLLNRFWRSKIRFLNAVGATTQNRCIQAFNVSNQ